MFYGIAVFPESGAQLAFDKHAGAFADIFLGSFGGGIPHHNVVPLCNFRQKSAVGPLARWFVGGKPK